MKVEVTEYEKKYCFNMENITQLCGKDVRKKSYILESIRRYYGGYKYSEKKNKWRDNVFIDNINTGRKSFQVISIKGISDITNFLKIAKNSLVTEYLKYLISDYDCQNSISRIDDELIKIYAAINEKLGKLGNVHIDYEVNDIWSIIQQSQLVSTNYEPIEEINVIEGIEIIINLLSIMNTINPVKTIVLFEDIDHLLNIEEYFEFIRKLQLVVTSTPIYFLISTSINGYVKIDENIIEGVNVINSDIFLFPSMEHFMDFIDNYYPCSISINYTELVLYLSNIIHNIGDSDFGFDIKEMVILKLINQSMGCKTKIVNTKLNPEEISFLNS